MPELSIMSPQQPNGLGQNLGALLNTLVTGPERRAQMQMEQQRLNNESMYHQLLIGSRNQGNQMRYDVGMGGVAAREQGNDIRGAHYKATEDQASTNETHKVAQNGVVDGLRSLSIGQKGQLDASLEAKYGAQTEQIKQALAQEKDPQKRAMALAQMRQKMIDEKVHNAGQTLQGAPNLSPDDAARQVDSFMQAHGLGAPQLPAGMPPGPQADPTTQGLQGLVAPAQGAVQGNPQPQSNLGSTPAPANPTPSAGNPLSSLVVPSAPPQTNAGSGGLPTPLSGPPPQPANGNQLSALPPQGGAAPMPQGQPQIPSRQGAPPPLQPQDIQLLNEAEGTWGNSKTINLNPQEKAHMSALIAAARGGDQGALGTLQRFKAKHVAPLDPAQATPSQQGVPPQQPTSPKPAAGVQASQMPVAQQPLTP